MTDKEELLTTIINDAKAKGAPLVEWQYSANGKIIILRRNGVPLYCINLFQAIDLLIHQYNLTKEYSFIYSQSKKNLESDLSAGSQTSMITDNSFESKTIALCNAIVLNPSQPFNIDSPNKIYYAIHKANDGKHISQNDFLALRSRLSDYYANIQFSSNNLKDKENHRKILRFFEKMRYKDYMELF